MIMLYYSQYQLVLSCSVLINVEGSGDVGDTMFYRHLYNACNMIHNY